jgi:hypothetical protein
MTANTFELAKQGDTQAIATLMNRDLEAKGITVQVNMMSEDKGIRVIGESEEAPNKSFFVDYVHKAIERLYIRGQIAGNKIPTPVWRQTINLQSNDISTPINTKSNSISKSNKFDIFNIYIQFRKIINTVFLGGILGILLFNLVLIYGAKQESPSQNGEIVR